MHQFLFDKKFNDFMLQKLQVRVQLKTPNSVYLLCYIFYYITLYLYFFIFYYIIFKKKTQGCDIFKVLSILRLGVAFLKCCNFSKGLWLFEQSWLFQRFVTLPKSYEFSRWVVTFLKDCDFSKGLWLLFYKIQWAFYSYTFLCWL